MNSTLLHKTTWLSLTSIMLLQGLDLQAAVRKEELCNTSNNIARAIDAKATGLVLNANAFFKDQDITSLLELDAEGRGLTLRQILAPGECVKLNLESRMLGTHLAQFRFHHADGLGTWNAAKIQDELDATALMSDLASTHEAHLVALAKEEAQKQRLSLCLETNPEECDSIRADIVSAQSSAEMLEIDRSKKLVRLKKLLTGAGIAATTALGTSLATQAVKFKKLQALRSQGQDPQLVKEFEKEIRDEALQLEKDWKEVAKDHIQPLQESDQPVATIKLPDYFEGEAPLANENISLVGRLEGVYPRDVKKITVEVDGKNVPTTFFTSSGLWRADITHLKPAAKAQGQITVWGRHGILAQEKVNLKKDSTTPKVVITQKGKHFDVSVKDQGLGFNQIVIEGQNVAIKKPTINFEKPVMEYSEKFKTTGNVASINVKANKNVVTQKLKTIGAQDVVAMNNEQGELFYPEEKAPRSTLLDASAMKGEIAGGIRINGQCCRDSSCIFCHPDTLLGCRQKGFSYWKFNDEDPACYKIKPL